MLCRNLPAQLKEDLDGTFNCADRFLHRVASELVQNHIIQMEKEQEESNLPSQVVLANQCCVGRRHCRVCHGTPLADPTVFGNLESCPTLASAIFPALEAGHVNVLVGALELVFVPVLCDRRVCPNRCQRFIGRVKK